VLATVSAGLQAVSRPEVDAPSPGAPNPPAQVRLLDLASVQRLLATVGGRQASKNPEQRAAAQSELDRLLRTVLGVTDVPVLSVSDLHEGVPAARGRLLPASTGVSVRDAAAYRMLGLGYSVQETADVVDGRISISALDRARRMLAVGRGRDAAADFLDGQYKQVENRRRQAEMARIARPSPSAPSVATSATTGVVARPGESDGPFEISPAARRPTPYDATISRVARLHNLDEAIVHAVIATESAFGPAAVSSAGAIGLMQLMPGTARELGVNPWIPEQNIDGGVRYLSSLIRMFGSLDLALVAYNGGPGFAQRYLRGEVALYGETRDYVRRVLARLRAPR
jgi:hypothetical protein